MLLAFIVRSRLWRGGGDDGSVSPSESAPMSEEMPEPETMEPEIVEPETDEPEIPETDEPEIPETDDLDIPVWMPWRGLEECVNTDDLLYFFNEVFRGETRIERFNDRPEISLAEGTTDFQAEIVRRAVEFINASLPDDYKIGIRPMRVDDRSDEPPSDEIYIDFAPKGEWQDVGTLPENIIALSREYSSLSERSAHIWVDPQYIQIRFLEDATGTNRNIRDGNNIGLLAHEILHALGFAGHVPFQTHVGFRSAEIFSIMWPTASIVGQSGVTGESRISTGANLLFLGILHEADRAGLRYLYEELETGDSPQSIEEADLDAWLTDKGCFSQ